MAESDVIGHLISVEHEAASMMQDAQIEADKRLAAAKVQADDAYKKQYEEIIRELENKYQVCTSEISQKKQEDFKKYQEEIQQLPTDVVSFNKLLDSLLFVH